MCFCIGPLVGGKNICKKKSESGPLLTVICGRGGQPPPPRHSQKFTQFCHLPGKNDTFTRVSGGCGGMKGGGDVGVCVGGCEGEFASGGANLCNTTTSQFPPPTGPPALNHTAGGMHSGNFWAEFCENCINLAALEMPILFLWGGESSDPSLLWNRSGSP